jgi:hypothetical protein
MANAAACGGGGGGGGRWSARRSSGFGWEADLYFGDGRLVAVGCARVLERWVEDGWGKWAEEAGLSTAHMQMGSRHV